MCCAFMLTVSINRVSVFFFSFLYYGILYKIAYDYRYRPILFLVPFSPTVNYTFQAISLFLVVSYIFNYLTCQVTVTCCLFFVLLRVYSTAVTLKDNNFYAFSFFCFLFSKNYRYIKKPISLS